MAQRSDQILWKRLTWVVMSTMMERHAKLDLDHSAQFGVFEQQLYGGDPSKFADETGFGHPDQFLRWQKASLQASSCEVLACVTVHHAWKLLLVVVVGVDGACGGAAEWYGCVDVPVGGHGGVCHDEVLQRLFFACWVPQVVAFAGVLVDGRWKIDVQVLFVTDHYALPKSNHTFQAWTAWTASTTNPHADCLSVV
eukprot:m.16014 g.16014  ORF g.16014 m.16014 type:complete len:196 (-) comp6886_c0_seq1:432-1019(-)